MATSRIHANSLTLRKVEGHPFDYRNQRGIALLVSDLVSGANAAEEFGGLDPECLKGFGTGFQMWQMAMPSNKRQHGFNGYSGAYKRIWRFAHRDIRIYGFLAHPSSNIKAQICCLVSVVNKTKWESEPNDLARTEQARCHKMTQLAVDEFWAQLEFEQGATHGKK